jgi:H+/Na+-translocating ferredoxin:NAD+ oxidoreductase subunit C
MAKTLGLLRRIRAGVHPPDHKELTRDVSIRKIDASPRVVIPMSQHVGVACVPVVKKGAEVYVGTLLGDADAFVSAPVHSSISGKVVQIAPQAHPAGEDVLSIVIENDGEYRPDPVLAPPVAWKDMEPDDIRKAVRAAGMVGLGGAAFPTHVKLSPPKDCPIDTVIINGAECEPYLTSDYRLLVEEPESILEGLRIIMKAVGATRGMVAIEDNKPQALKLIADLVRADKYISVSSLKTRYPQGAEKVLITNLLGLEVPSGGLPMHVGVIVNNVGTAHAIARYFSTGMPLVERVVTVTGSVMRDPSNLMVPLGTSFAVVVEACGGFTEPPGKVIMGGPMMGLAQYTLEVPVIKATSGILALSHAEVAYTIPTEPVCIRCGRCVDACPMNLLPTYLAAYAHNGKWDDLRRLNINDCIECGCCTYACPTKNPIVQLVKMGKSEITRSKARMDKRAADMAAKMAGNKEQEDGEDGE